MLAHAHHPAHSAPARRAFSALLLVGALLLVAAMLVVAAPRTQAVSTVSVEISNFSFQPASVTIQVGDTVTWTNLDSAAHTATDTGSGSLFDGVMNQGESFSYTFTQPGTFNYVCTFHPQMTGTVVVQGGSQGGSPPPASQLPDGALPAPPPTATMSAASGWLATVAGGALLALGLLSAVVGARRRPVRP